MKNVGKLNDKYRKCYLQRKICHHLEFSFTRLITILILD